MISHPLRQMQQFHFLNSIIGHMVFQSGTMPDPSTITNYTGDSNSSGFFGGWSFPTLNWFPKVGGFLGDIGNKIKGFFGSCE